MFMVLSSWQSHCESSSGSFDECRMAPSGRRPKTKPDDSGCESTCTGCQNLHPPSPFIIVTQPESWYSFYRPTEGRRLSRSSWLVTYSWFTRPQMVTHPGTNRVWRSATTLIEANALPLSHTATGANHITAGWHFTSLKSDGSLFVLVLTSVCHHRILLATNKNNVNLQIRLTWRDNMAGYQWSKVLTKLVAHCETQNYMNTFCDRFMVQCAELIPIEFRHFWFLLFDCSVFSPNVICPKCSRYEHYTGEAEDNQSQSRNCFLNSDVQKTEILVRIRF